MLFVYFYLAPAKTVFKGNFTDGKRVPNEHVLILLFLDELIE